MTNVAMNLLLVKYRQQFGISRFVMVFLTIYAGAAVAELFVTGYPIALGVRAISGVTGAAMGALTVFYMLQALPPKYKLQALVLGIGASQLGMPLARILSARQKGQDPDEIVRAVEAVDARIEQFDRDWSRFRDDSLVTAIARGARDGILIKGGEYLESSVYNVETDAS